MKAFSSICLVGSLFLWASCSGKKDVNERSLDDCPQVATWRSAGNDSVVVLDVNLLKDTLQVPLSQLVEEMDIVKLDARDTALVKGGMVAASDNYILVGGSSVPCKLFDKKGRFLHQIGKIGQGPGEYTNIYNSQIDEAHNRIYLLPWTSKQLLAYDLQGNLVSSIPLPYVVPKGVFHVDTEKELLTVGMLPFEYLEGKKVLWQQDFRGKVTQEVNAGFHSMYGDYSNEVSSNRNTPAFDFYIFRWAAVRDSLYHFDADANRLAPVFTADFGAQDIPKHAFAELPDYYVANIITEIVNGTGMPPVNVLVDKKTLKGAYCVFALDCLGNIPVEYPYDCFREGRFLMCLDPGDLTDRLEQALAHPDRLEKEEFERLTAFKNVISADDNNYVLIGKLKAEARNLNLSVAPRQSGEVAELPVAEPEKAVEAGVQTAEADTVWSIPFNTATLPDALDYFRTNNRYKDWDAAKGKRIMIGAVVEKDGRATDVKVVRAWDYNPATGGMKNKTDGTCGVKELDEEAIRLIREAKLLPGKMKEGTPVRSKFVIMVEFPPK